MKSYSVTIQMIPLLQELLHRTIYFLRFYKKKLNVLGNILMWELKRNHIRTTRDSPHLGMFDLV